MQLEQLHRPQLCVSGVATEAIRQQQIVKLNGILCRQEHYHFALAAVNLAIKHHMVKPWHYLDYTELHSSHILCNIISILAMSKMITDK